MKKKQKMEWLNAVDIESGVNTRVRVPAKLLKKMPKENPAKSKFIQRIHTAALIMAGREDEVI